MARADIMAGKAYVSLYMRDKLTRDLMAAKQRVNKFGADMMALGTKMVAMSAAIAAPLGFAVKKFAEFDDAMRMVKAVTSATGDEFQSMTDKARDLGRTTSFSATEVASLMTELGRAGFKPDEINQMTAAVMNLARATGTEATLSAGIMAATIRQFSLDAGEAARVADVLTAAANSTFNTVEGLGDALGYAGPIARELGLSLEDTVAILGTLGNVGIQGSNAGTALRRLGVIAAANGKELKKIFNIDNTDAAGNLKPLVQVMEEIGRAVEGLPVAEKMAKMKDAFGLLGVTAAASMKRSAGSTTELAEALRKAGGTAEEAAEEMDSGFGGAMRILASAADDLQLSVGNAMQGVLTTITKTVTDIVARASKWIEANKEIVATVGAVVFAAAGLGFGLISLGIVAKVAAVGIGIATTAIGLFKLAILSASSLLTPVGIAIGAVAAAVALATVKTGFFSEAWQVAKGTLQEVFDVAKRVGGILMEALAGGDYDIAFKAAMAGVKIALVETLHLMINLTSKFFEKLYERAAKFMALIQQAANDPLGAAAAVFDSLKGTDSFEISLGIDTTAIRTDAEKELDALEAELEKRKKEREAEARKKETDEAKLEEGERRAKESLNQVVSSVQEAVDGRYESGELTSEEAALREKQAIAYQEKIGAIDEATAAEALLAVETRKAQRDLQEKANATREKVKREQDEAAAKRKAERIKQDDRDRVVSQIQDFADADHEKGTSSAEVVKREIEAVKKAPRSGLLDEDTAKEAIRKAKTRGGDREHQARLKKFRGDDEKKIAVKAGKASAATFSSRSLIALAGRNGEAKQVKAISEVKNAVLELRDANGMQASEIVRAVKRSVLKFG